ncbi:MAG: NAD(P)/FAD-dependent oxidoreductase [Lautropia sp.]
MTPTHDLIVVGEGVAGLACAGEAARLGLGVASFEAEFFGGLVVNVNELEQFEEARGASGIGYAGTLAAGNKKAGVRSMTAAVTAVRAAPEGFEVRTDGSEHTARFVVIASGARLRKLRVPGETEFEGRGVSHCADCDAPLFAGAPVVVAGAGNWALQDALLLARDCSAVHVVHEGAEPAACADFIRRARAQPRIHFHPRTSIEEVLGNDGGMTGVRVRGDRGDERDIAAPGLFVLAGLEPNSGIAPAEVERDQSGYLQVDDGLETTVPGIWAIGQVRSGFPGWLKDALTDARRTARFVKARRG